MRKRQLLFSLVMALMAIWQAQAQNLISGWDNTSGTPYDAGWRVDASVSVTWGTLNAASGNKFRTNLGSPVNNTTNPMLYIVNADTRFGYPVTMTPGKYYQLAGNAWRRNGSTGSATFNFYLADNLLATNYASKASQALTGNNVVAALSGINFIAPAGFTSGYFLWDVHNNSGTWNDAGVWLLNLTEAGDANAVTFNTDGGNSVATQYFIPGTSYTITQPSNPTKSGYIFGGWYTDATYTTAFNFSTAVTTNTTVYAKFSPPNITTSVSSVAFTTSAATAMINATGVALSSDITITVPSSHVTLSGGNLSLTSTNTYTIALVNANQLNTITATWDKGANVSGDIVFTSGSVTKNVSVSTDDVESAAMAGITLSAGGLNTAFAVGTTSYTAKAPADVNSITVSATTTPSIGNVTNSGAAISASSPSVVLTGNSYNGAGHSPDYTVTWNGNYGFTDWAANGNTTSTALSNPATYGWKCINLGATGSPLLINPWNYINNGNCRYNDSPVNYKDIDGVTQFTHRILYLRWDGGGNNINSTIQTSTRSVFSYPILLQTGTVYQISGKAAWNSNSSAPTLVFNINGSRDNPGTTYSTVSVAMGASGALKDVEVANITVPGTGVYYLTIAQSTANITAGTAPLCAITDFVINTKATASFNGSIDNNWSNASNWSSGRVPLAIDDVIIPTGSNITVDANANAAAISVAPSAKITLNNNKTLTASSLTLQSDATGTATFVNNGTANITTATVNQYLTGTNNGTNPNGRGWYVSTPVTAATSAVFSASGVNGLWKHRESAKAYTEITSDNETLNPGQGYVVRLGSPATVSFTGALNDGNITINNLTRTDSTDAKRGFNLIGNPYPSCLDWKAVGRVNVRPTIWYRGYNGSQMVFDTYNGSVGTGNNGVAVTQYIPPMQAVWVRVETGIGSLALNNAMRSHQAGNNLLRSVEASELKLVRLKVSNATNSDEAILALSDTLSNGYDSFDAPKLSNGITSVPEIFTYAGAEPVAINGLNSSILNQELTLGFKTGESSSFSICATEVSNLDVGITVVLVDKKLGTEKDLTDGNPYNFTSDAANTTSRFAVVLRNAFITTGVKREKLHQDVLIYRNPVGKITVKVIGRIDNAATLTITGLLGQILLTIPLKEELTILDKEFKTGIYLISVKLNDGRVTRKMIIK